MGIIVDEEYWFNFTNLTEQNLCEHIRTFTVFRKACLNQELVEEACEEFNRQAFPLLVPLINLRDSDQRRLKKYLEDILRARKLGLRNQQDNINDATELLTHQYHTVTSSPSACAGLFPLILVAPSSTAASHLLAHGKIALACATTGERRSILGSYASFEEATFALFSRIITERDLVARSNHLKSAPAA